MGLFDFIGQTAKIATRVAILPVAVAKDVVTMGGVMTDDSPATLRQLKKLAEDIEDLPDSVDR